MVIVFGGVVVSSDGHIMTPPFFSQGLRVYADTYVKTLRTVAKPTWTAYSMKDPISYNKIRFYLITLSIPTIEWPRIFIITPHQIYGLLTHQTFILWITTCKAGRS
ncbi:hypothetical protein ACTXT7_016211 [Hymenolepis weldensis]